MSGITGSSERFIPNITKNSKNLNPHSDELKLNSKEKIEISKQSVRDVKTGSSRKVLRRISTPSKKEAGLNVKSAIESFENPISSKSRQKLNYDEECPVDQLIRKLAISITSEAQEFRDFIIHIPPGRCTIEFKDHIIYVSKPKIGPMQLAIINIAEKAFAKGGFGKVYKADLINMKNPLVLKLSRKKLKSKDSKGDLISLTKAEKEIVSAKGSSRGADAKKGLTSEYKMMRYIKKNVSDSTGIICDALIHCTYKNQSGFFIKEFDFDGTKFSSHNPSTLSRNHFAHQICCGFLKLNELEILHRDIKLENTLLNIIPGQEEFLCEAGISDFGGACLVDDLFTENNPYPSFSSVLGSGTKCNTSYQIACDIDDKLEELKNHDVDSDLYNEITDEIKQLMVYNDEFSMGLMLYQLWTDASPPFLSYENDDYLRFDKNLNIEERQWVLDKIELEVYSACLLLPEEEANHSVELVMDCLKSGLDINRK